MSEPIYALDASALLAMLQNEAGGDLVADKLMACMISSVNLSEVAAKLSERGLSDADVLADLENLHVPVASFDHGSALAAGVLRRVTRHLGLSFGDRACVGLAIERQLIVLTAERLWPQLDVGVKIELIR